MCQKIPNQPNSILSLLCLCLLTAWGGGGSSGITGDGAETGNYSACLHGGEYRLVQVTGITSCTGLTAADVPDLFDWTGDASSGTAQMATRGLKRGKLLSDLIDFTGAAWKQNAVQVSMVCPMAAMC